MENGVMMQYFEWNLTNDGKLWKQLKEDASHLHEIGVTAIWIPPAYKADEQQDEGYATYDLYDLGEFEQKGTVRTKYGTKDELKEMIDELHKNKIAVYLDVVLNHKAGGDFTEKFMVVEVDPDQRNKALGKSYEIQGWTGYSFHGRKDKYSDFKWHYYHFSGTGFDDARKRSGIFQIQGEGKAWSDGVDGENGNYDFLLCNDIDLDHPEVVAELNRWGKWVSNELDLDGMRLDAIKHMKDQFVAQFLDTVRSERGDDFYAVGEYWNGDLETLDNYLEAVGHKVNLFDVPLHYNMFQASQEGKDYDLRNILKNTLVEHHCELAVTFVDNHDSQHGSSLESQVEDWFKPLAYGLIFLLKDGYPCLFYGDYYGVKGEKSPHTKIIDILLNARKKYAYGDQVDYFDHPSTVGFIRTGDGEHVNSGLVFLISNDEAGSKTMCLGKEHAGEVWCEITGSIPDEVTLDKEGNGEFSVDARNLAVWVKKHEMTEQFIGKKKLSLSLLIKIVKDTGQGFIDDSVTRLSGSLAYATLFSIIPFLSLLVTIGVALHMDLANQLYIQWEPIVGAEVIGALRLIIENAERTDSSASAAIVSLGISIFGATTIFAEIQSSLNSIWGIKAVPKKSWLKYIQNRLLSFSIILVFAFVLLITFSITNIIGDLSNKFMASYPEVAGFIVKVVGQILNIGVTVIIFVLIFKVLPDAKIKSKDVFIGAVVTTLLLLVGQWGISFYIGIANVGTIYGAAAFMVVFITWIYYSAIIVYAGAEFTKAWANEMGSKIFPDEYAVATKVVEVREA